MTDSEAQVLWDECMTWSSRTKALHTLEMSRSLFQKNWSELPRPLREVILQRWRQGTLVPFDHRND